MKRKLITACIVVICFILQSTLFNSLALAFIKPNLMIVVSSAFGFMRGKKEGMLVGFFSGLLIDIVFCDLIGFYALIYCVIGYLNGFFRKIFYDDDIKLPLILITASDFIYGNIVWLFMFVMRGRFDYFYYLKSIILPELIYTVLITLVLYQIILLINKKLELKEKRSASKFV